MGKASTSRCGPIATGKKRTASLKCPSFYPPKGLLNVGLNLKDSIVSGQLK